jgi:hypothetical protein
LRSAAGKAHDVEGPNGRRVAQMEMLIGVVLIVIAAIEIVGIVRVVTANQPG